jgi:hypothetical protein
MMTQLRNLFRSKTVQRKDVFLFRKNVHKQIRGLTGFGQLPFYGAIGVIRSGIMLFCYGTLCYVILYFSRALAKYASISAMIGVLEVSSKGHKIQTINKNI